MPRPRLVLALFLIVSVLAGCTGKASAPKPASPAAQGIPEDATLLPAPADLPAGGPAQVARSLAAAVLEGGAAGRAALITALSASGIAVDQTDGSAVHEPAAPEQGLAFQAGEVLALARLMEAGSTVPLSEVVHSIARSLARSEGDEVPEAKVRAGLLEGLRDSAAHRDDTRSTWALFVAELGRQATPSFDLLATKVPGDPGLGAVQVALITQRLAGDAYSIGLQAGELHEPSLETLAALAPFEGAVLTAAPNCKNDMLDHAHMAGAKGGGWLLQKIAEGVGGETAKQLASVVLTFLSAALGMLQAYLSGALTTMKIELETEPLRRTKQSGSPGERTTLKATVEVTSEFGNWANCMRTLMNAVGLDASLPQAGQKVSGAKGHWELGKGAGIVEFYALSSGGNAVEMTTDADGQVSTGIEGKPQEHELTDSAVEVEREFTVAFRISLKDTTASKSIVSAVTSTFGISGLNPAWAIQVLTETMSRWQMWGVEKTFDVTDYAADYRVDWSNRGYTITGTRCAGESGSWDLDLTGGSGGVTARGSIFVQIPEGGTRGPFGGHIDANWAGGSAEATFGGSASLSGSGEKQDLVLTAKSVSGGLKIADVFKSFSDDGSELTLPAEVGDFCSGA